MTHICVSKIIIISSDNGLSHSRRQAIIGTNVGILLIGPLGTNFSETLTGIPTFSFKKMLLKKSAKWRPFYLGLNVLPQIFQKLVGNAYMIRLLVGRRRVVGEWIGSWWRHQKEKFSALLALCVGSSPVKASDAELLVFSLVYFWIYEAMIDKNKFDLLFLL